MNLLKKLFGTPEPDRRATPRKAYSEIISPLKTVQEETQQYLREQEGMTKRLTDEIKHRELLVQTAQEAQQEATTFLGNLKLMFTKELAHKQADSK